MRILYFIMRRANADESWRGGGWGVSQMLTIADRGGVQEPLLSADVICEQTLFFLSNSLSHFQIYGVGGWVGPQICTRFVQFHEVSPTPDATFHPSRMPITSPNQYQTRTVIDCCCDCDYDWLWLGGRRLQQSRPCCGAQCSPRPGWWGSRQRRRGGLHWI